jgi:hypothetical protein
MSASPSTSTHRAVSPLLSLRLTVQNINKKHLLRTENVRNAHVTHPRLRVSGIYLCIEMCVIPQGNNEQWNPVITTSVYMTPRL